MQTNLGTNEMYKALLRRDSAYEGLFFVAVKTTGIFCRPTCHARKPKRQNVEFFSTTMEAILRGYRPCRVCHPMKLKGEAPSWVQNLLEEIKSESGARMSDSKIKSKGIDPNKLRRWFKQNYKMTFQAYLRSLRLGRAFGRLASGQKVVDAAFDSGYESLSGFSDAFKKQIKIQPSASSQQKVIHVCQILSPLGPLLAGSVGEGICLLEFMDRRALETEMEYLKGKFKCAVLSVEDSNIKKLRLQLDEYFTGQRQEFDVPLVLEGTEFQKKVWKALLTIPYGQTRSYKEQAQIVGNTKAVRAVARGNGQNRIAIVIPCHRVIGSDGEPVGYGGGLWRKKFLLDLENKNR